MKKTVMRLIPGILSAACLTVLLELAGAALSVTVPLLVWLLFLAGAAAALILIKKISVRALWFVFLCSAGLILLAGAATGLSLFAYSRAAEYRSSDQGKAALFADRKVLVIAPHQDDDLNIASGVMEEYLRYGSQVRVLFVTNGDFSGLGERRLHEALNVSADLGLAESDVIFLGYGDAWGDGSVHIYDQEPDTVIASHWGYTETYGLEEHPAYHNGHSYTRRNLREDLKSAILDYMPDVILCADRDSHADHIATSLFFEEVLGKIMKSEPGYEPLVLKSLCYSTAFFAPADFYSENILSTQRPGDKDYMENVNIYDWNDRIRLPISGESMSRGILGCDAFWRLRMYSSQSATKMAENIISGDKVFWQRETNSLCYDAEISVSSGEGERLNDFKLLDAQPLIEMSLPDDGAWMPDAEDPEKSARIAFPQAQDISLIKLYDNPNLEDNVLNARISFDDGSSIETGPLKPTGGATEIQVDKKDVESFTVQLLRMEGERAGLTEIEAYSESKDYGLDFIKLMNVNGDFVYDYYIDESGHEDFTLYVSGGSGGLAEGKYSLSCEGDGCAAQINGGEIRVDCPSGKSCVVTVSTADGSLSDSVYISNPGAFTRHAGQRFEAFFRHQMYPNLQKTNSYLLLRWAYRMIRYGTTDPLADIF